MLFDISRVSKKGSEAADWDRNTWPELQNLAKDHPEAGVHFQSMQSFSVLQTDRNRQ